MAVETPGRSLIVSAVCFCLRLFLFYFDRATLFVRVRCSAYWWWVCVCTSGSHLCLFTDAIITTCGRSALQAAATSGRTAFNAQYVYCMCLFCAEAKAAAVAGISDILSFKDSLSPTAHDGESCSTVVRFRSLTFFCKFVNFLSPEKENEGVPILEHSVIGVYCRFRTSPKSL